MPIASPRRYLLAALAAATLAHRLTPVGAVQGGATAGPASA